MKRSHWWVVAAAVCVVAGFVVRRQFVGRNYVSDLFGGKANMETVRVPGKVQAWQTLGFLQKGRPKGGVQEDPKDFYTKGGAPVLVPTALAERLSKHLLTLGNYYYNSGAGRMCVPQPGFVLTFTRGNQSLDVFICFECDILVVNAGGGFESGGEFDPSHNQLLQLIKAVFPNEGRVQGLPEKRRH